MAGHKKQETQHFSTTKLSKILVEFYNKKILIVFCFLPENVKLASRELEVIQCSTQFRIFPSFEHTCVFDKIS